MLNRSEQKHKKKNKKIQDAEVKNQRMVEYGATEAQLVSITCRYLERK